MKIKMLERFLGVFINPMLILMEDGSFYYLYLLSKLGGLLLTPHLIFSEHYGQVINLNKLMDSIFNGMLFLESFMDALLSSEL
jgi:hypothetical protein